MSVRINLNKNKKFNKAPWLALGVAAVAVALTSCTQVGVGQQKAEVSSSSAQQLAEQGRREEASAELVRIAEALFKPAQVRDSELVVDQALALHPENPRALFLKAMTQIAGATRGIFAIAPHDPAFDGRDGGGSTRTWVGSSDLITLNNTVVGICSDRRTSREFQGYFCNLGEGQLAARTYQEWSRYLRTQVLESFASAQKNLQKLESLLESKRSSADVYADFRWMGFPHNGIVESKCEAGNWPGAPKARHYRCKVVTTSDPAFRLDAVDVRMVAAVVTAAVASLQIQTAYSWEGYEAVVRFYARDVQPRNHGFSRRYDRGAPKRSVAEIMFEFIRKQSDFLVLEKDHQLDRLAAQFESIGKALIAVHAARDLVCENYERMIAPNLFKVVCIRTGSSVQQFSDEMFAALDYLKGPRTLHLGTGQHGERIVTTIDLSRLLSDAPPKDLKRLLPTHFDAWGNVQRFEDATLGGIFPEGDLVQKIHRLEYLDGLFVNPLSGIEQIDLKGQW